MTRCTTKLFFKSVHLSHNRDSLNHGGGKMIDYSEDILTKGTVVTLLGNGNEGWPEIEGKVICYQGNGLYLVEGPNKDLYEVLREELVVKS